MSKAPAGLPPLPFVPRGVLFDMDGLLFDSETLYRDVFFELLDRHDLPTQKGRFEDLVGLGWQETRETLEEWFSGLDGAQFIADWKEGCRPESGRFPAMKPGVVELLDLLEEHGISAALATGSQRLTALAYLRHHDLADRFLGIIAAEDCPRGKPHPDPFEEAARTIDLAPSTCIALEDSPNGIRSAHAAGCLPIFVPDLIPADDEIADLAHGIVVDLHEVRAALE